MGQILKGNNKVYTIKKHNGWNYVQVSIKTQLNLQELLWDRFQKKKYLQKLCAYSNF